MKIFEIKQNSFKIKRNSSGLILWNARELEYRQMENNNLLCEIPRNKDDFSVNIKYPNINSLDEFLDIYPNSKFYGVFFPPYITKYVKSREDLKYLILKYKGKHPKLGIKISLYAPEFFLIVEFILFEN